MAVMAMFPLGSVLLPGAVLPLHVFEERYRQMVVDLLEAAERGTGAAEFGVVLIERGSEVGGGDRRSSWGTVARLVQVAQASDGRYAVVAVGTRRLRVVSWLADEPYPRAEVEDWPEDGSAPEGWTALVERLVRRARAASALAVELGDTTRGLDVDLEAGLVSDIVSASHLAVQMAPIGEADRQDLLAASSPLERLERLDTLLGEVEQVLRFRLDTGPI